MSFFGSLFANKQQNKGKHVLSEEDREAAAQKNSLKWKLEREKMEREAELDRLKAERDAARYQADIALYREQLPQRTQEDAEDGNSELATLATMFMASRSQAAAGQVSSNPPTLSPNSPAALHLTDEQIDELLSQAPKAVLKMAKNLSLPTLRKMVEQKFGAIDDDTFSRAVNKLKA